MRVAPAFYLHLCVAFNFSKHFHFHLLLGVGSKELADSEPIDTNLLGNKTTMALLTQVAP